MSRPDLWTDTLPSTPVAVQIRATAPAQLHVALVFDAEGVSRALELAWHRDVRCQLVENEGLFAAPDLHPANARAMAMFCDAVAEHNATFDGPAPIPYWIGYGGEVFTAAGRWLHSTGLTCATFVYAIFLSMGYQAAVPSSWSARDEDAVWQCSILRQLAVKYPDEARVQRCLVGCTRLRPEEVAVALVQPPASWPTVFSTVDQGASALRERLGVEPFSACFAKPGVPLGCFLQPSTSSQG